ncbi:hypothetical protein Q3G72_015267 [Acer saccharum]|nr:hypothetical protein Q3G72_015267 [Acer saccharum]
MGALARQIGCTVAAFDRPGWGLTSRPRQKDWEEKELHNPYKLEAQVDLLLAFCSEMGFSSVVLVGHDDGGLLALKAAQRVQLMKSDNDQDPSKTSEKKVEKSGKKTRRKQSSGAKSILELQTEDENVSCKNVNLAIDGTRELEVDASSILTKKNLVKTSTEHQLNGSICKPGKIACVETDPLHSQLNVKSSQVLSYKLDGNNGESPLQVKNSKLSEVPGTGTKAPPPSNKSDKFNSKTKEATSANTVNASRMIPRSNKKKET